MTAEEEPDTTTAAEAKAPARPPKPAKNQLRVGRLVKAHGLKGAIKLELYTDDPEGRFVPGATFTLQVPEASPWHGKTLTVREFKWMNSHPVAFFEGVDVNLVDGVIPYKFDEVLQTTIALIVHDFSLFPSLEQFDRREAFHLERHTRR